MAAQETNHPYCHSERAFCVRNLLFVDSFTNAVGEQQIPPCRCAPRRNDKRCVHTERRFTIFYKLLTRWGLSAGILGVCGASF